MLNRCHIFAVLILILPSFGTAQQSSPGGIPIPFYWFVQDAAKPIGHFTSKGADTTQALTYAAITTKGFNFHPAAELGAGNKIILLFNPSRLQQATIFTVYAVQDTTVENCIWHFAQKDSAKIVLTTDRLADLNKIEYMNFVDKVRCNPKLNIYIQSNTPGTVGGQNLSWQIGGKPALPNLPIKEFKGLIPEIIVYNRLLTSQERLQVGSYLALKYGITLSDPSAMYLNSSGTAVWKGADYLSFHYNIAGIARDDSSGVLQKISSSGNLPGLLTVSTNDSLTDNGYLLWGDNNLPLSAGEPLPGLPAMLQKNWLFVSTGLTKPLKTNIEIDVNQFDVKLPQHTVYWLAVNKGGEEKPAVSTTEFFKMDKLDARGLAHFDNIPFHTSGNMETLFLIAGQDLLLSTQIKDARCLPQQKGGFEMSVHGGLPPFSITATAAVSGRIIKASSDGMLPYQLTELDAGQYTVKVTDKDGRQATDSFFIRNEDAPFNAQLAVYKEIPRGSYTDLDAGYGNSSDITYLWQGPDHFLSTQPRIHVGSPGLYSLTMSNGGCSNLQQINIRIQPENIFNNNISVYPNPSSGRFTAVVSMGKPAPVLMEVCDASGKLVTSVKKQGMANYRFDATLFASGYYRLTFSSGQYKAERNLIITK